MCWSRTLKLQNITLTKSYGFWKKEGSQTTYNINLTCNYYDDIYIEKNEPFKADWRATMKMSGKMYTTQIILQDELGVILYDYFILFYFIFLHHKMGKAVGSRFGHQVKKSGLC